MSNTVAPSCKRYLLTYHQAANLGGVQTLMARMAHWIVAQGHEVTVLILTGDVPPPIRALFPEGAKFLTMPPLVKNSLAYPFNLRKRMPAFHDFEAVIAFCPESLLVTRYLKYTGRQPALMSYVVYVSQYCGVTATGWDAHPAMELFRNATNADCVIFMSDPIRQLHEQKLQRDFERAYTLPLPLECERWKAIERRPQKFEIVSVGRIDWIMKLYNFSCVPVIRKLRDEGIPVRWTIYGGAYRAAKCEKFIEYLKDANVEDCVRYMGEVDYSQFPEILSTAYAFIGMGTAVLEAAAAGVPSIVAIAEEPEPISQGLVHEMPVGSCGELVDGMKTRPIDELLRSIVTLDDQAYQRLCDVESDYIADNYDVATLMRGLVTTIERLRESDPQEGRQDPSRLRVFVRYQAYRLGAILRRLRRRA